VMRFTGAIVWSPGAAAVVGIRSALSVRGDIAATDP
jgi:hypothetical protein